MTQRLNSQALTAVALLIAESKPAKMNLMTHLITNLVMEPAA